ncbi:MAG: acetoin utilization protein AcuC [Chloroflexi bacterium]|nr:acetoin utilization protein AcuC [Chloroflexota bacterium]
MVEPRYATDGELAWFHSPEYIAAVKSISAGEHKHVPERYNFSDHGDNPPYDGMYEAACLSTGGSLVAAQLVADGEADVAFNVAGGLHHAARANASGFCIFNDPVIAIEYLRRRGLRPMYIDIDCHHGDGVQAAFYDTPEVMTISMHESGKYLFPGTGEVEELGSDGGRGYSVNVPLAPYTGDDVFRWAFDQVVPPLVRAFEPDVIVTQLGIDTHFNDPVTHLQLTVEGHGAIVNSLGNLCPRWVALGGGGYDISAVARGWSLDYGIMMGVDLPDGIPAAYDKRYGLKQLRDGEGPVFPNEAVARTHAFAEDSVSKVQRLIFPIHHLA